jgi:hypothetical protein
VAGRAEIFARNSLCQKRGSKLRAVLFGDPEMRNLVLLVVLIAVCLGLAQTRQGHAMLSGVGLYEQPASYTELTFTTPGDLPSALPSPSSPINVSFTIHNVSAAARAYQWSVVLTKTGQQGQVQAAGTAAAPAQGRVTVSRSVSAACTGGRLQVLVRLASVAERIDFWVTCPAAGQGSK